MVEHHVLRRARENDRSKIASTLSHLTAFHFGAGGIATDEGLPKCENRACTLTRALPHESMASTYELKVPRWENRAVKYGKNNDLKAAISAPLAANGGSRAGG